MRRGFTLLELLIVLAMIAVLSAAIGVSVGKARTRARIALASQETREMTNAILAFEQYAEGHTLAQYATGDKGWRPCESGAKIMKAILGLGEKGASQEEIPVLYEANVSADVLKDPWGHPYEYMIAPASVGYGSSIPPLATAPALPNYYRLSEEERR